MLFLSELSGTKSISLGAQFELGSGIFTQMNGLSLPFRVAYDDYKTDYDYTGFQAIYGYDFSSVTDDSADTGLYLYYIFW